MEAKDTVHLKPMKIHFIAIGGTVMHNLAIALHEQGYQISGSDEEIYEPSRSELDAHGLLPQEGWDPGKIHSGLDAVILGMNVRKNNKELKKALELGIRIYSFPEYLYEHSKNKKRIVIGGSYGKSTITAMVMQVLKTNNINFDYMVGSRISCFERLVRLTPDAPFIILEGDEYMSSPVDRTPKFHLYHPHMTLLSGIAWDHMNAFKTFENYKKQFRKFLKIATGGGKVFYYENDPVLGDVVEQSHWSLLKIPYGEHPFRVEDNRFILQTKYGSVPLKLIGKHNMQNIMGAMMICRDLGIEDHQFYQAIQDFQGIDKRQQLIAANGHVSMYIDYAQAPASVEATVNAFRETYRSRRLITCLELHTFSSLNREYLPLYKGSLDESDEAMVFFDPELVRQRKLPELTPEWIRKQFGKNDLKVFTSPQALESALKKLDEPAMVLLFMTAGKFAGLDLQQLAQQVALT